MVRLFYLLLPFSSTFAMLTGNPADPAIFETGIVQKCAWWSFRLGYLGDYTYKQHFRDEFQIQNCEATSTFAKMYTNAGVITFNLKKRWDLYAIVGASRIQIEEEAFSKTKCGYGFGTKLILYRTRHFFLGTDLKYFASNQKPLYFICDNLAYNIVNDYHLKYEEIQASCGISYQTKYIAPYLSATYIHAAIRPSPSFAIVEIPSRDFLVDVSSKSVINHNRWGFALGATLIDQTTAALSFEWRAINQNSINVVGELRF